MSGFIPIHTRNRAKQIYDYTGLDYGKCSPTDIDGLVEMGNKGYIIIELKRPNAKFPTGQRLALERMIDDFVKVGKTAVLILAENAVDNADLDVVVADCRVLKEYDGTWHDARHSTVRDVVYELFYSRKEKETLNMNSVVLVGRITRDVELKYVGSSQLATARFNIAIDRPTKSGEKQTDFPTVVCFGKTAENCDRYVGKGSLVAVNGRIQTGSYKNKNGDTVYTTEVVANNVEFLGSREREPKQESYGTNRVAPRMEEQTEMPDFEAIEADVPF